jgi:tetratricopeptide (TPR) repeat protein
MVMPRTVAVVLVAVMLLAGCAGLVADTIESLMKQGIELLAARRFDEAIAKFMEVIRRDPKFWSAYLYLARSYLGKSSWSDAIVSARKALELAPNAAEVIPTLAEAFLGAGLDAVTRRQFPEAIGHLTEYIKLRPADAQGYLQLGRVFLETGAYGDALRTILQGLTRVPEGTRGDLVRTLFEGGARAFSAGQFGDAIAHFTEYIKQRPTDGSGYLQLGRSLLEAGAYDEALRALVQGFAQSPDAATRSELSRTLLDGGTRALSGGHARSAAGLLQEYVKHDTGNVSAYLALGKAYWHDGRVANALGAFRRVLELSPNNAEALQFLGRSR